MIDAGEVVVALHNDTDEAQKVPAGSRIAQLIIMECPKVSFEIVDELNDTERGESGFGSTGLG